MLKTPLCDLLNIEVPIILAPMGTCTSGEFAAEVSNNGGLGGVGSLFRTATATLSNWRGKNSSACLATSARAPFCSVPSPIPIRDLSENTC